MSYDKATEILKHSGLNVYWSGRPFYAHRTHLWSHSNNLRTNSWTNRWKLSLGELGLLRLQHKQKKQFNQIIRKLCCFPWSVLRSFILYFHFRPLCVLEGMMVFYYQRCSHFCVLRVLLELFQQWRTGEMWPLSLKKTTTSPQWQTYYFITGTLLTEK